MSDSSPVPNLVSRIPAGGTTDPDQILDLFLEWVAEIGFELYPAQEEALLEIMAGRHVVLSTPTGSGKSLVALGLHFKGLCEGRVSLLHLPHQGAGVGEVLLALQRFRRRQRRDAHRRRQHQPRRPVICCTAEVLANLSLRLGTDLEAPYVVMDEFHYYADRDRGWAWQVPLINAPTSQFLLMSATLGDMTTIISARRSEPAAKPSTSPRPSARCRSISPTARRRSTRP